MFVIYCLLLFTYGRGVAFAQGNETDEIWSVPFQYAPPEQPFVVVEAQINQGRKLRLLVDTAANTNVLLPHSSIAALRLKVKGKPYVVDKIKAQTCCVDTFSLKTSNGEMQRIEGVSALEAIKSPFFSELFKQNQIEGLIGLGLFQGQTVTIDFEKRLLTVSKSKTMTVEDNSICLPMTKTQGDCFQVQVNGLGGAAPFYVDTGAEQTTFNSETSQKFRAKYWGSSGRHITVEGIRHEDLMLVPQITLGNHLIRQIFVSRDNTPETDNLLGIDILSRFVVTMDLKNSLLFLKPIKKN